MCCHCTDSHGARAFQGQVWAGVFIYHLFSNADCLRTVGVVVLFRPATLAPQRRSTYAHLNVKRVILAGPRVGVVVRRIAGGFISVLSPGHARSWPAAVRWGTPHWAQLVCWRLVCWSTVGVCGNTRDTLLDMRCYGVAATTCAHHAVTCRKCPPIGDPPPVELCLRIPCAQAVQGLR